MKIDYELQSKIESSSEAVIVKELLHITKQRSGEALVLDSNWQPIGVISWEESMRYLCSGKARIVEAYPDIKVRTVQKEFDVPSVLQVQTSGKYRPGRISPNAANVFFRDKYTCAYCGEKKNKSELTIDHIFPIVQGGKNSWKNLISACKPCNQKKGGRTPLQANMKLKFRPHEPGPSVIFKLKQAHKDLLPLWSQYLFGMDEFILESTSSK
jgi:5-methylcytosine-specific restriction endonuclease McrA